MAAYLFQIDLADFTEELINTIPQHRAYINKLFANGGLLSYSVSIKRNCIWCVINADTEHEAMEQVAAFPLHTFFTDVTCHELLFHNTQSVLLPDISLN